jgi:ElaB/YqjD/DUF883 family membrane-anchored ribosome-binding protein
MASAAGKTVSDNAATENLEAEIKQLKADIEKLARQLARTGELGYGSARKAATEGVEQLRAQGEAAMESLRGNAGDLERKIADQVREKPVTALAVAAGLGFLFALLSRR